MEKYFLSSTESFQLSFVRECEYIREIRFNTFKSAEIVKLSEPLQWKDENGFHGSDFAVITARHAGYAIRNISSFPTFIYAAVLKNNQYDVVSEIKSSDLIVIGIGELYKTYEDAKNHKFD